MLPAHTRLVHPVSRWVCRTSSFSPISPTPAQFSLCPSGSPPSPAPPGAALLPLLSRRAIMHAGKEVFVLDFQLYDQVQASLGAVSDNFRSNLQPVLDSLHTDPETKAALQSIISETSNSLDELARLISTSLTAASR